MSEAEQESVNTFSDSLDQSQSILIVDDESRIRSSLRILLGGTGREIQECETGLDAIAKLKSQDVDLVLLDINLPDISGLEVLEWIANNKISTSVIFVSADDSIDSAILALRYGAIEFVRKPLNLEEIRRKVENALYRRRMERSYALMTARMQQSEQLHRFLVENSPDLIYTLDDSGRFMFINSRVESLLGYSREELIGKKYCTIVHDEDVEKAHYAFNERRVDSRATANLEVRLKCRNDHFRYFDSHYIVAMMNATGIYGEKQAGSVSAAKCFMGTYGVARDITERKIAEETISFQALHDQLTHLPNQRLFKDRLEMALALSKRHGGVVGVMFIDLDRFKLVNDTYGHAEGDELLKKVAHRLQHCMRAGDTLARKGGDEFTVLLPDLLKAEDASIIADKILNELRFPFLVAGQEFRVTASIGIAVFPRDGESVDVLLKNADIAMYRVKADGKNDTQFYIPDMNACYHERINLENDLRHAIVNSEFELYYQPKISVIDFQIVGMEALIRWHHPLHGLMNPRTFIDLAEEVGLIGDITDWVLAEACSQLARWHAMGLDDLRMSVNVSPQEFQRSDMVERVSSQVNKHCLPDDSLEIEITENILLHDAASVIKKMSVIRDLGVRISIDDFGTCYSSLNYLRLIPISTIKIDQSFVRDLSEEHRSSAIIQAIVDIAKGFGLHLVAEGVETNYQMKTLQQLGCDEMQGYLFSRPVPAAEAERLLNNACDRVQMRLGSALEMQPGLPGFAIA
ncbi:MAG: EAL domain-containing protein [Steroidobacteraceae bacterium]|nr:EAL domain-containing protein [Deltaproteobacteria bacterium]